MKRSHEQSVHHWVDIISTSELPAITSTAKMLDKFNNDDKSSLPKLSKAILHDQALASCLLKVANSVQHLSINKVSTVSRASVVLGIQAVKNICLTSRLVEGLLAKHELDEKVFQQLTQSMASSFHAGLLAKMMAPQYAEDTREELYLAAMLYSIGETAFWSAGGESALNLVPYAHEEPAIFEIRCQKEIGTSFTQLSAELARTWNLSDLLLKALDSPESRTIEVQIIYLADRLSSIISNPYGSRAEYEKLLEDITEITGLTHRQLTFNIAQVQKSAVRLLKSYGAASLVKHIHHLPQDSDFEQSKHQVLQPNPNKDKELLELYMQLTSSVKSHHELSEFLQLTLCAMAKTFSFEQCSFFMLVNDKKALECRFSCDINGNEISSRLRFNLTRSQNLMSYVLKTDSAVLINNYQDKEWYEYITSDIATFINHGALLLLPVKIGVTTIGVISAQVFVRDKAITTHDTKLCNGLIEHLSFCLTSLSH